MTSGTAASSSRSQPGSSRCRGSGVRPGTPSRLALRLSWRPRLREIRRGYEGGARWSARDVIARATCGDRDEEGWIPCTECEENAERVVAAMDSMSTEDLVDLLRNRLREVTVTVIDVTLDHQSVIDAVRRWRAR